MKQTVKSIKNNKEKSIEYEIVKQNKRDKDKDKPAHTERKES